MNRTLMAYMLAAIVSFSAVAGITIQPIPLSAQTQSVTPQQTAPLATSPSCGQVVTTNVVLSANLICTETDGIIVGADSIKIDLNGHTITGPDVTPDEATTPAVKDSSKVGIMVPNHNNVQIVDGTIEGFQAGVLCTGCQNLEISGVTSKDNQIGIFSTGASVIKTKLSTIMNNQIGFAGHSTQQSEIANNIVFNNDLAGITLVNSDNARISLNSITESQNGIYVDNQSNDNFVFFNNVLMNTIDVNNANGLPVNTNNNQYDQNNCMTSNPSGICIGK
ncbi:MAG TPA: NosD domain-containing protein [Nitrososphaeraceae archaeon]|nr:NosD domain-containing protein [Nitrososphaeraceae archaeon]